MFAQIPELAAHAAASAANGFMVGMYVEGVEDIWDQLDKGRDSIMAGEYEAGLAFMLIAWNMLEDRLPRLLAVQVECSRLRLLAAARMQVLPAAERTVRLRANDEEQARIDDRVARMQGMRHSIENVFLAGECDGDTRPELKCAIDTIKQRRSARD
jgi:hypothetical protein